MPVQQMTAGFIFDRDDSTGTQDLPDFEFDLKHDDFIFFYYNSTKKRVIAARFEKADLEHLSDTLTHRQVDKKGVEDTTYQIMVFYFNDAYAIQKKSAIQSALKTNLLAKIKLTTLKIDQFEAISPFTHRR